MHKTVKIFIATFIVAGLISGTVWFAFDWFGAPGAEAAAPTFVSFSGIAASTGADVTVTLPAHAADDILLLEVVVRDQNDTITWPSGWTQIATADRGATSRYWWAWRRAASASETNPLVDKSTTTGDTYAAVIVYRGATASGDPWEVKGTPQTTTTDPSSFTGITTLTADSLVVAAVAGEDNNNASITTTGTNPAAYAEHYVESNTGSDGVITFSEAARTTAGVTGNISVNWNSGIPVGAGGILLALKPNVAPSLSISEPNGTSDTIAQDASFTITYTLSDPDNIVTAALYYDTNNSGLDGTAISGGCASAAEGTGATCSWNTTGVTPGSYYVYGITNDGTNPQVSAYSGGTMTINARPTLSISQPDGVSDTVTQGDSYNVTYSLADSDNVVTAAFYYDSNGAGLDGTAITGACASAAEGSGVTCSWNTTGVTPGSYYVYGITNDGTNAQVSAYSGGTITISTPANVAPSLSISQPDGVGDSVTVGDSFAVTYTLSDPDNAVTAAFYYDANNSGLDGTAISGACATAAEGTGSTCSWNTTGVTPGNYYVYGITNDGVNPQVSAYSSGTLTVNAVANTPPTLSISQPDGTSDTIAQDASFNVTYTLSDPDNVVTTAFYYDTDNSGLNGTAISGACATAAEGTGATCSWNTTGVTPGSYYVYGITNDGTNPQVSAYSGGTMTINARPTLSISQPDGVSDTVTQGDSYNVTYSLADSDNIVTAAFYYDSNSSGLDGTAITGACASAAEGSGVTCSWNTTGVTPGSYYVYGITNDGTNAQVSAYSGGTITISTPANTAPSLSISQPDGVGDSVTVGDSFAVTYTLSDPDNVVTAAFYYDSNNSGLDGTAISGACASAAEGTGSTCSWNTTGVSTGSYYVYGITNDGTNPQVSAYSTGTLTVNAVPVISVSGISPTAGALAGGTSVTISGSNFQSGATVKFDGISATNVVFVSSSSLTATTPAHAAGSVNVMVTNPDLTSDTLIGGFTYTSSPVVTITASPLSIFTGESSVINWSTENATACTASGAWSGSKATSGNETVAPPSSSTYTLECTGAGGSGSGSVTVTVSGGAPKEPGVLFRFDGFAYPDGKVFLYDNGAPFSQLISDLSGRFATSFRLASIAEKHLFSIIAYDKEGNASPNKTFPTELYERGGLTDILIAPTIMLNKRALGNGESLRISGYATPGNKVQMEIDGKIVGIVPVSASGYYAFTAPLSSFTKGDHRARSIQVTAQSRMSDYSLLKAFQISDPFVVYADLNNDGKLTISDWSIFLSCWASRDADVRRRIDFNGDGKISIFDLSVFLSGFRKR